MNYRRTVAVSLTLGIAVLIVAAGVSNFAASKAPVPAPAEVAASSAGDAADATCVEASADAAASKKPCRTCPDKPYCTCTYNGQPRISCDPCCYQTYTGVICKD